MYKGIAKIEDNINSFSISIPSQKNLPSQWFMLLWSVGWVFGLVTFIYGVNTNPTLEKYWFNVVWLITWILGGVAIASLLLWSFFGQERITLSDELTILEKTIFNIGLKKCFSNQKVQNIRYQNPELSIFYLNIFSYIGLGLGKIRFESGFKTYSFAPALDENEAKYLAKELNKRIHS